MWTSLGTDLTFTFNTFWIFIYSNSQCLAVNWLPESDVRWVSAQHTKQFLVDGTHCGCWRREAVHLLYFYCAPFLFPKSSQLGEHRLAVPWSWHLQGYFDIHKDPISVDLGVTYDPFPTKNSQKTEGSERQHHVVTLLNAELLNRGRNVTHVFVTSHWRAA